MLNRRENERKKMLNNFFAITMRLKGYTNPCNEPQRPPTGPNGPQRPPTTPNEPQWPPTIQINTPTAPNDPNYYSNGPQRPKLLLQRPPTIQNIIITSSNDPKINTITTHMHMQTGSTIARLEMSNDCIKTLRATHG